MELFYKFSINAARRLPNLPAEHVCSRLHGHTFLIELWLSGEVDPDSGWVVDFADLDSPVAEIMHSLEHRYLNDIDGLSNPTSENLAIWVWDKLSQSVPELSRITVMEGLDRGCSYTGSSNSSI